MIAKKEVLAHNAAINRKGFFLLFLKKLLANNDLKKTGSWRNCFGLFFVYINRFFIGYWILKPGGFLSAPFLYLLSWKEETVGDGNLRGKVPGWLIVSFHGGVRPDRVYYRATTLAFVYREIYRKNI